MTNSPQRCSADIVEQIARTLALSYGRDPDALTEWTEMCDADNRPVPIWKVYEEQAEAVVSKHLTGDVAQGASLRQALIEVTKCETALRMGGPAPEDLEGLSIALEKAVEIAANALDAAQPQVAPVDVLPTQHRDASKWPSKADIEAAHNGSSAGNGDDLSRRARELADEPVIGTEGRKLLRQMATEIEDLRHDIDRHIQIATDIANEPQPLGVWQPIETAPKDGTPIEACNTRHPSHAPVIVRWDGDGLSDDVPEPHWCDAATRDGEALYYNQNYFDFWKPTTALPRPHGGGK